MEKDDAGSLRLFAYICTDKTSVYDLVFLERYYFSSLTVTGINKAQYIHLELVGLLFKFAVWIPLKDKALFGKSWIKSTY